MKRINVIEFGNHLAAPLVGKHLNDAIIADPNCTPQYVNHLVLDKGPIVVRGPLIDGVAQHMDSIGLDNPAYIVDDREIIRKGISYTIDTIESVVEENRGANIYLIIGSDILPTLNKWKDFSNIMLLCNIIVLARMTKNNDSLINKELKSLICSDLAIFHGNSYGKIYLQDMPLINISSTEIRSRLQKNQKVSNLIPLRLDQWLQKWKIY